MTVRQPQIYLISFLLTFALAWPSSSRAQNDHLSGAHLQSLVPETLDGYTRNELDVKESSPSVRGVYQLESDDGTISFAISYGKDAADRYRKSRGKISLAAGQGEMETGEVSVQGRSVITAQMGSQLIAMAYFNHFLVGVNAEGLDVPESTVVDFLEKVGLDRIAEWSPPDDVEYTLAETEPDASACVDMDCFSERVTQCEEAQLIGALGRRVTARYAVEGPAGDGQCRLSFVFTDNPNADWENTPLYFTVDSEAGFSMKDVKTVMEGCVERDGDPSYDCEGPLLERMRDD